MRTVFVGSQLWHWNRRGMQLLCNCISTFRPPIRYSTGY